METIFNIFPIFKNDIISKIGYKTHTIGGTDEEKIQYLKEHFESDIQELYYISIPSNFTVKKGDSQTIIGISLDNYNNLLLNQTHLVLFEEIFALSKSPDTPLFILTLLVDGKMKIDESIKGSPTPKTPFTTGISEEIPKDYLVEYTTEKGFEIDRLLNDDFLNATKVLFQEGYFVSTIKLIVSAMDTIAFLEFGDVPGNFKNWINEYCDVEKLGITKEELWEYRNSILHMTNSNSRKVLKKEIHSLSFYVSNKDVLQLKSNGETKYFNLTALINEFAKGLEKWGKTFNLEPNKLGTFIERYDSVISESRYRKTHYS